MRLPASPPSELSGNLTNHCLLDRIAEVFAKTSAPIAGSFVFWQGQIIVRLVSQERGNKMPYDIPKPPGGFNRTYSRSSRSKGDRSGSSREENDQFKAVCRRAGMNPDQSEKFHRWLHENHGIDGKTTDMKFNQLLSYAEEWMSLFGPRR